MNNIDIAMIIAIYFIITVIIMDSIIAVQKICIIIINIIIIIIILFPHSRSIFLRKRIMIYMPYHVVVGGCRP